MCDFFYQDLPDSDKDLDFDLDQFELDDDCSCDNEEFLIDNDKAKSEIKTLTEPLKLNHQGLFLI